MHATGIIVEYNPFHNGHLYHLQQTKEKCQSDIVIAIMSGNFLQRGEPALVSKWMRTKMAIENGVDLVFELPYAYAVQNANTFARGAVSMLHALGAADLCFGSESGNLQPFLLANTTSVEETTFKKHLQSFLKEGDSYPVAYAKACKQSGNTSQMDLSKPNNILGFHYIKEIVDHKFSISPVTITRTNDYHDQELTDQTIASATSIRHRLFETGDLKDIANAVPLSTLKQLEDAKQSFHTFVNWENLFPYLKFVVMTHSPKQLHHIHEAKEGLEFRLTEKIVAAHSFEEFMRSFKTKRYTWSRLQRFCLHVLTQTTKKTMCDLQETVPYLRVLGMNEKGQSYLKSIKKQIPVPIVSNVRNGRHPLLQLDLKASLVYSFAFPPSIQTTISQFDYTLPPLRYDTKEKKWLK